MMSKRILALDLGTSLGYAHGYLNNPVDLTGCGSLVLASAKEITAQSKSRMNRRLDCRIPRLNDFLTTVFLSEPFDWLVWEDVQFASSTMQVQLWSSFRTTLWLFAAQRNILTECCPVGTLKKSGAGHGGATKNMMGAALSRQDKRFTCVKEKIYYDGKIISDDAVDAVHLLKWSQKVLKNA